MTMNKKLSEEELDAKFEEFMQKLSTDEEASVSSSHKQETKNVGTKDTLWWLKEDGGNDNKVGGTLKPSRVSWLKSTTKPVSTEKPSNAVVVQPIESAKNVTEDKGEERTGGQSEITERGNSPRTTESSMMKTSSRILDSKTSQILTSGGDYSEDFESGRLTSPKSSKHEQTETQGDVESRNEHLDTLDDLTLNSEGSDAESRSSAEQPSPQDRDNAETSSDHQSVQGEGAKPQENYDAENSASRDVVPASPRIGETNEEENRKRFGQETFIIKSNIRGIDEILKEADEIERSSSLSLASRSSFGHTKKVQTTIGMEKPPVAGEYPENVTPEEKRITDNDNFVVAHIDSLNLPQLLKEERKKYAKLRAEVWAQEEDTKKRLENQRILYEKKLLQLEAENIHLSSKIDELGHKNAKNKNKRTDGDDDGLVADRTHKLRKEFKEQELLIVGYQRENEQLYDQLRNLKNDLKRVQADHGEENQRLSSELAKLKRNQRSDSGGQQKTFSSSVQDELRLKIEGLLQEIEFLKAENLDLAQNLSSAKNLLENANTGPVGTSSEVSGLKTRIVALENEIGKKNLEQSSAGKVLGAKESRIQSLEKQVRQLEQLVRVRHPNHVSTLVLAAGVADDNEKQHRTVQFLEDRVRELEERLSSQNAEENSSLREVHDQFAKLKEHYEARISQLEDQKAVVKFATTRPQSSVTALEKELDGVRERHRKETEKMKNEIADLRQRVKHKTNHQSDDHLALKVRSMANALAFKDKQIKVLQKNLDEARVQPPQSPSKSYSNQARKPVVPLSDGLDGANVELENRTLKAKVQHLAGQVEPLQEALRAARQKSSNIARDHGGMIRKLDEEIAARRKELGEAQFRLRHANEKLSEIIARNEMQEVIANQLKQRLSIVQVDSEQIKRMRSENAELRLQVHGIRERLVLAEAAYPPEWKHYAMLEARVSEVEKKYRDKCAELQALVERYRTIDRDSAEPNAGFLLAEVQKWKALVESRNGDMDRFRLSMDEIIVALESLYVEVHGKRKIPLKSNVPLVWNSAS